MREQDFKLALRDTMELVTQPPPMNETEMLDAAKQSLRHRRAMWTSAGSVAGVVALVVAVALTASGAGQSAPEVGAATTTSAGPSSDYSGQREETAGPVYDKGVTLLNDLVEAVPQGLTAPADLTYVVPDRKGEPLRVFYPHTNWYLGAEYRSYFAAIPVTRNGQLGQLHVEVITPGGPWYDGEGCELAGSAWNPHGAAKSTCQEVVVSGTKIPVATATSEYRTFDQAAAFRYPDGVVVFAAQDFGMPGSGQPAMTELPLSPEQLARLATDPRFHLD